MKILGICPDVWISSAVLIDNGTIVAAGAEERFNRQKMSKNFPIEAIAYCLEQAKCSIEDVDYIAMGWNPGAHIKRPNSRMAGAARWRPEYLYSVPSQLSGLFKDKNIQYIEQHLVQAKNQNKILYVPHHLSHAANAFYLSPHKKAAIMTIDGRGEDATALFAAGNGNRIKELQTLSFPHSLGLLYGTITEFLGFKPDSDEWKVMALASAGKENNEYYKMLKKMVTLQADGLFEMDLSYFSYYIHDQEHFYTDKFIQLFGKARNPDDGITFRHKQIAAALQQLSEEIGAHMLTWLHKKTKMENVVLAGGFFMNSVFNGKVQERTPFKQVFISACPDDSGTSIGAALYVYNHLLDNNKRDEMTHNFYGPEFSNKEIKASLDKYHISYEYVDAIEEEAASLISKGNIIGWFQGKMEFGQRALGNRSILADPRKKDMKDKVNSVIKYRGIKENKKSIGCLELKVNQLSESFE